MTSVRARGRRLRPGHQEPPPRLAGRAVGARAAQAGVVVRPAAEDVGARAPSRPSRPPRPRGGWRLDRLEAVRAGAAIRRSEPFSPSSPSRPAPPQTRSSPAARAHHVASGQPGDDVGSMGALEHVVARRAHHRRRLAGAARRRAAGVADRARARLSGGARATLEARDEGGAVGAGAFPTTTPPSPCSATASPAEPRRRPDLPLPLRFPSASKPPKVGSSSRPPAGAPQPGRWRPIPRRRPCRPAAAPTASPRSRCTPKRTRSRRHRRGRRRDRRCRPR